MTAWLIAALAGALGALAAFIQQVRLDKARGEADAYKSRVADLESKQEVAALDIAKLEKLASAKSNLLKEVQDACRDSNDPTAVRVRLSLLFNPEGLAAPGQQSLPFGTPTPTPGNLVRGR